MVSYKDPGANYRFFRRALSSYAPPISSLQNGEHYRAFYQVAKKKGATNAWNKLIRDYEGDGNTSIYNKRIPMNIKTNSDMANWYAKYLAAEDFGSQQLSQSLQSTWDDQRGTYESKYGNAPPSLRQEDFLKHDKYLSSSSIPSTSSYAKAQQTASDAERTFAGERPLPVVGTEIPGLGVVGAGGQLNRGIVTNVGGGILDTELKTDDKGDYVSQGPKDVQTATKTLRPKFDIAGGEDVRPNAADNLQSDALFEAFSWVPDGYGLGPYNNLHLLNKQNDQLRFGMESLYQPRMYQEYNPPRHMPRPFADDLSLQELEMEYARRVGISMMETQSVESQQRKPTNVLMDDYNANPSSQDLPRQVHGVSPYDTVIDTYRRYLPARDPSGLRMNALPRQDIYRSTWGYRRENVYNSISR